MLAADTAEDVFHRKPILLASGEPDTVIRQNPVDFAGHRRDEVTPEMRCDHLTGALVHFGTGEPGRAVDGHEETGVARTGAHFSDIDMEMPDGVAPDLVPGFAAFDLRQATDAMPLLTPMRRRPG